LTDIAYEPAFKLAGKLRSREIGCLELLDHHLARVERFNPALNAVIWTDRDAARERARQADQVLARGETGGRCTACP
jgi:amidase